LQVPANDLYLKPQIKKTQNTEENSEKTHKKGLPAKAGKPPKDATIQKNQGAVPPPSVTQKGKKTPTFSKPNNHQLIKNAIVNVCLAGDPNKKRRQEVLEALNTVPPDKNVIVLFKDVMGARQDFKALYVYNEEAEKAEFIYGPKECQPVLDQPMINDFYRYDSGAKEFKHIPGNKNFSLAIDAVSLKPLAAKKKHNIEKLV